MGRRRHGLVINGWLIIDKAAGMSSAAVVTAVRRATGAAKVGHGGTLDPLATGVLPIALGEATKTVAYVMDGAKTYVFTVRWGEQRNTDDADGDVVAISDVRPTEDAIRAALPEFVGHIEQVPPVFSAVKIEGQRAYALARADVAVTLQPRMVYVESIRLIGIPDADHAVFEVAAGKGTYMRSLARDLAVAVGSVGHVAALRRVAVGPFGETRAIPLDKITTLRHSGDLGEHLLPVGAALDGIPALNLTEAEARRLRRGQPVAVLPVANRSSLKHLSRDAVVCAMAMGQPVALAKVQGGEIRPLRVLNL